VQGDRVPDVVPTLDDVGDEGLAGRDVEGADDPRRAPIATSCQTATTPASASPARTSVSAIARLCVTTRIR